MGRSERRSPEMANFEKVLAPPLFDFDGFDSKVIYQMVPEGETRAMSVVTDDDECTIIVNAPTVIHMRNFAFDKPAAVEIPRDLRARVPRQNRLRFEIVGDKKGRTTISLVDSKGKKLDAQIVSVKGKITRNVAMCRLSDIRHNCPFLPEQPPLLLPGVQKVFKQQANIEITQHQGIFDVTVPINLATQSSCRRILFAGLSSMQRHSMRSLQILWSISRGTYSASELGKS